MELIEFYRAVLPEKGLFALFSVPRKKHVWTPSVGKLVELSNRVSAEANWYYATAGFADMRRTQDQVALKRCLYLDIDAGAEKHERDPDGTYPSNEDALVALVAFARATKLVPSIILHSGAGLHVYYALDRDLGPDEWLPLAKALGATAKAHGLKVDSSCTTDSARVLRFPGALHKNGAHARVLKSTGKIYAPDDLRTLLPETEHDQFGLAPVKRERRLDVNSGLVLFESAPTSALKVAQNCAALREVAELKGDVNEPRWRAMIGVVKACVEGLDLAQEWSSGHPDYDDTETEEKYNRYEVGPTTCEHFSKLTSACKTCPHWGKIKSPIVLGRLTVEQVDALPPEQREPEAPAEPIPDDLPFAGAEFGDEFKAQQIDGRWCMFGRKVVEKKTDEGVERSYVWVKVCDDVVWAKGWIEAGRNDDDDAQVEMFFYNDALKKTVHHRMPGSVAATSGKLFEWLSGKGVTRTTVDPQTSHLMHNMINQQYNMAKRRVARLAVRKRFGMQFSNESAQSTLVCAHGKYIIRNDGTLDEAVLTREMQQHAGVFTIKNLPESASGHWPASVWKTHILPGAQQQAAFFRKYYLRDGFEPAQLAVMLSMSSPFMVFAADTVITPGADLPQVGLSVSLYSPESGKGKTSIQKAVASCYGDPASQVGSGSLTDATPTNIFGRAAVFGTMPFFLDEVTRNPASDVALIVDRMAQGNDKGRGDRSGAPRPTKTWALITTLSSNTPQRELLASFQEQSDALQMRLIEINCSFPKGDQTAHVEFERDRSTMLAPNYGALGALINFAIVRSGVMTTRQLVHSRLEEAAKLIPGSSQRERFMQRGMACVLSCHDALQRLGIELFSRDVLIEQYKRVTIDAVEFADSNSRTMLETIQTMVSSMAPNILLTHNDRPADVVRLEPIVNRQFVRSPYVGREVTAHGVLYLLMPALNRWCSEHQVSSRDMVNWMRSHGLLVAIGRDATVSSHYMTITRGTDMATMAGRVIAINTRALWPHAEKINADNVVPLTRKEPVEIDYRPTESRTS